MLIHDKLSADLFFEQALQNLSCDKLTKAYILNILLDNIKNFHHIDISTTYINAVTKYDFKSFQSLGDWIFFLESIYPKSLRAASQDFYFNIGRMSYFKCYKLLNRKWPLYEELSDQFIGYTQQIHSSMKNLSKSNLTNLPFPG
jgi:hypothetical protein